MIDEELIKKSLRAETESIARNISNQVLLELVNVSKTYPTKKGNFQAVKNINLQICPGEFVVFLGPSGCGKTTTLRMIAGFEHPTEGDISIDGKSLLSITADKRPMSMVFQSYALFPHLTVRGNVEFGLKLKKLSKDNRIEKVDSVLSMMGIAQYADRYPHQLSGGQQQRVALARALVMEPKVILFDEPLSNLDAKLRIKMRSEIRSLQKKLNITSIFVTHDQAEALTMADKIVVMSEGKIEQVGSPWDIYHHPRNRFVASFLGTANFINAKVLDVVHDNSSTHYRVDTVFGELVIPGVEAEKNDVDNINIVVREENLRIGKNLNLNNSIIKGVIESATFDGEIVRYTVKTKIGTLVGSASGTVEPYPIGDEAEIYLDSNALWCINN